MVEQLASKRSVQHHLYSSLPYRPSQRSVSSLELSKGNSAPWTTGTSVRSAISVTRSACWVSSFTHWSPLKVVMPRTSNLSDCRKTKMACWSLVPGPRASWSTIILILWAAAVFPTRATSRHTIFHTHRSIVPLRQISVAEWLSITGLVMERFEHSWCTQMSCRRTSMRASHSYGGLVDWCREIDCCELIFFVPGQSRRVALS